MNKFINMIFDYIRTMEDGLGFNYVCFRAICLCSAIVFYIIFDVLFSIHILLKLNHSTFHFMENTILYFNIILFFILLSYFTIYIISNYRIYRIRYDNPIVFDIVKYVRKRLAFIFLGGLLLVTICILITKAAG